MDKLLLNQEFEKFWLKIKSKENFALLRYGDGERAIMCGHSVTAQEGWKSPEYISHLGYALLETLNSQQDNIYYGISCPCCDRSAYYWYSTRITHKNRTFANLWVNGNYNQFISNITKLKRDAVVIANHHAKNCSIGQLNILGYYYVDDDCISFWDNHAAALIEKIKADFGNRKDILYIISAGYLSAPIIIELYKNNPENCYIDFGSCLDTFIHKKQTRPYMGKTSKYSSKNCWIHNPKTTNFDVSVVLNLYKRPENLSKQLQSIENQTLKPKEIIIFQDHVSSGSAVSFPDDIRHRFNLIEISPDNKGVWGRFYFANNATSEFICIFDDDTIAGSRWLENCHYHMQHQQGLYGTNGILMFDEKQYPKKMMSVGWKTRNKKTIEVDFVGHSWFFKKEWLNCLYQTDKKIQDLKICGEDMSFSYQLLNQYHIKTFVPPHPPHKKYIELYGSLPDYGYELGDDGVALSGNTEHIKKYNQAMNILLSDKDWDTYFKRHRFKFWLCKTIKITSYLIPIKQYRIKLKNNIIQFILSYPENKTSDAL